LTPPLCKREKICKQIGTACRDGGVVFITLMIILALVYTLKDIIVLFCRLVNRLFILFSPPFCQILRFFEKRVAFWENFCYTVQRNSVIGGSDEKA